MGLGRVSRVHEWAPGMDDVSGEKCVCCGGVVFCFHYVKRGYGAAAGLTQDSCQS